MKRVIIMSLLGLICFTSVNAQTKKVVKPTKATVEVLYFHSKQRCPTCIAVGTYSKEVVDKDFAAQVKSGAVKFRKLIFQLPKERNWPIDIT